MKRHILFSSLILFCSIPCLCSVALGSAIFGPMQYTRTTGKPDIYSDNFNAAPGPATLMIKNGDATGGQKPQDTVSGARVLVNGNEIFRINDFVPNVFYLEAELDVFATNTLYIELYGKPDSYITVEIRQESWGPVIHDFTALPRTLLTGESTRLNWTTSDADACYIEPDIGHVPVNGSLVVTPEATRTYTLTASGPGGTTALTVSVTVDPAAQSFTSNYSYNARGELIQVQTVREDWSEGNAFDYLYDEAGNRLTKTVDVNTP
jgi:hypothetical protein